MRRHSHVLIASPHVSDQSLLLVAHRGERLSCFRRKVIDSNALRRGVLVACQSSHSKPVLKSFSVSLLALVVEFECSFGKILRRPTRCYGDSDRCGGC